jgi:Flp pilus assembly protein TadB
MPIKFYLGIAALLLGLVAGTAFYWLAGERSRLRAEIEVLQTQKKTAQDALKKAEATSAYLRRKNAATARAAASATRSLERSLAAQPVWADQPVPKEVQDALAQP